MSSQITAANHINVVTVRNETDDVVGAAIYRMQKALLKGECAGYKILNKKGEVLASWLVGR